MNYTETDEDKIMIKKLLLFLLMLSTGTLNLAIAEDSKCFLINVGAPMQWNVRVSWTDCEVSSKKWRFVPILEIIIFMPKKILRWALKGLQRLLKRLFPIAPQSLWVDIGTLAAALIRVRPIASDVLWERFNVSTTIRDFLNVIA